MKHVPLIQCLRTCSLVSQQLRRAAQAALTATTHLQYRGTVAFTLTGAALADSSRQFRVFKEWMRHNAQLLTQVTTLSLFDTTAVLNKLPPQLQHVRKLTLVHSTVQLRPSMLHCCSSLTKLCMQHVQMVAQGSSWAALAALPELQHLQLISTRKQLRARDDPYWSDPDEDGDEQWQRSSWERRTPVDWWGGKDSEDVQLPSGRENDSDDPASDDWWHGSEGSDGDFDDDLRDYYDPGRLLSLPSSIPQRLTGLTTLILADIQVPPATFSQFSCLSRLQQLMVSGCCWDINAQCTKGFSALTALTSLALSSITVLPGAFSQLSSLSRLQKLKVQHCQPTITAQCTQGFSALTALTSLTIASTCVEPAALNPCTELRRLELASVDLKDTAASAVVPSVSSSHGDCLPQLP